MWVGIEDVEVVFVKDFRWSSNIIRGKHIFIPHIKLNDFTKVGAVDNREFKT